MNKPGLHQFVFIHSPLTLTLSVLRITTLKEVNRRHESDLDRAHDDMFASRDEIIKYEESLPKMATHHRYYQDLRGYVTDLVECYDEKVGVKRLLFHNSTKIT